MSDDGACDDENPDRPRLTVKPHYGNYVTGDRRFPREDLEAEFDTAIMGGSGGSLFGLRRIGKSSEAAACAQRLRKNGTKVLEIDVQGKDSEGALLLDIISGLPHDGLGGRVVRAITQSKTIAEGARLFIEGKGGDANAVNAYFPAISAHIQSALRERDGEIALFIDEFPWLCRSILQGDPDGGRARVDRLLAELRRWRAEGMRMLLTGSIGMTGLCREYRLDASHLNDLTRLSVPPLNGPDEGRAFVEALIAGSKVEGWSEAHTSALLEETVAWYPSILQYAFQQMAPGSRAVPVQRIPEIFATNIRPNNDGTFFEQFDKRIHLYGAINDASSRILPELCECVLSADAPVTREALRQQLELKVGEVDEAVLGDALKILHEDGFLHPRFDADEKQSLAPASRLVTAWRNNRMGKAKR